METKVNTIHKALRLLDAPANVSVLLAVMSGFNYATKVAETFGKRQPVATRQLVQLKKVGLLRPFRKGKITRYAVDWTLFLNIFHYVVSLRFRENAKFSAALTIDTAFLKNIKSESIPNNLIIDYYMSYFDTVTVILDLEFESRNLDHVIDVFFTSLDWVSNNDKENWRSIIKKYNIDKGKVEELIYQMTIIMAGAGINDLQSISHHDIRQDVSKVDGLS